MNNYITNHEYGYKLGLFAKGKRYKKIRHKKYKNNLFTQITIILLFCLVTGTIAYMIKQSSITNEFIMGEVKTQIIENFDSNNKTKKDVNIKNIGNVPAYIRATIVISWKDNEGKVLGEIPEENVDYSIKFSESSNWIKEEDGYYYYKKQIEPNESTEILIEECKQLKEYDNKILEVTIANQTIQAQPTKAMNEAWEKGI